MFSRNFSFIFYVALIVFLAYLFGSVKNSSDAGHKKYGYRPSNSAQQADKIVQGRIRVVFPFEKSIPRPYSPFGPGMDEELLNLFLAENNLEANIFYARSYKEALELIRHKRCDLVVGFGGDPAEESSGYLAQGPVYASVYPLVVKTPHKEHVGNMYSNVLSSSATNENSETLLLLDPHSFSVLVPMYNELHVKGALKEPVGYRWFWNVGSTALAKQLEAFWDNKSREELLAEMRERYYGFIPKTAEHQNLRALAHIIAEKMNMYSEAIAKAAEETGLDPLLIAAVIFQESRFDPEATSYTGVRGLMQLTSSTAKMLKVDRLDPEQSILGGARYLRDIRNSLQNLDISEWDRWCFTLAAYNQGPANLRSALRLAETLGVRQSWTELRGIYAQLQDSGGASKGFRPQEALGYVENVRYYYYVMSRLVGMAGMEEQNLASLLLLYSAN